MSINIVIIGNIFKEWTFINSKINYFLFLFLKSFVSSIINAITVRKRATDSRYQ
jgi:hypothetical protein